MPPSLIVERAALSLSAFPKAFVPRSPISLTEQFLFVVDLIFRSSFPLFFCGQTSQVERSNCLIGFERFAQRARSFVSDFVACPFLVALFLSSVLQFSQR